MKQKPEVVKEKKKQLLSQTFKNIFFIGNIHYK